MLDSKAKGNKTIKMALTFRDEYFILYVLFSHINLNNNYCKLA